MNLTLEKVERVTMGSKGEIRSEIRNDTGMAAVIPTMDSLGISMS